METIHAIFAVIKRMICFPPLKTDTAAINNTTFLPNVSQFVNTHASPKQPQSDTGFANARYSVSGVITIISNNARVVANRRRIPKNKNTPTENSNADNTIANSSCKYVGNHAAIPKAVR